LGVFDAENGKPDQYVATFDIKYYLLRGKNCKKIALLKNSIPNHAFNFRKYKSIEGLAFSSASSPLPSLSHNVEKLSWLMIAHITLSCAPLVLLKAFPL
jgi:hypothetical protein